MLTTIPTVDGGNHSVVKVFYKSPVAIVCRSTGCWKYFTVKLVSPVNVCIAEDKYLDKIILLWVLTVREPFRFGYECSDLARFRLN